MAVNGMFSSDAFSAYAKKQGGFAGGVIELEAVGMTPLITNLGRGNIHKGHKSTQIEWQENVRITGINYVIDNLGNPTGSTLKMADTSWITENMTFQVVSTGEVLFVRGISGTIITVQRGFGGTAVTPINPTANADVAVQRIGTAFQEGSERPGAVATQGMPRFNYLQIFRNSYAVTRTATMVSTNEGDLLQRVKRECLLFHTEDIERSILLGVRAEGNIANQPFRSFDGILRQLDMNNASPAGGILTERALNNFFERVFSVKMRGSNTNERIGICGSRWLTLFNDMVKQSSFFERTVTDSVYGMDYTTYLTPHGKITFIPHQLFNTMPGREADLVVLHPDSVHLYYMYEGQEEDRDSNPRLANGIDGTIGGLVTEMGMILKGRATCGMLTGVTSVRGTAINVHHV